MVIQFPFLCPLSLNAILNFNISKVVCWLNMEIYMRPISWVKPVIHRGYYMLARGYEFYLRVVNSISHE